ncbi:MAG: hypothetical protein O2967_08545 [Proteobacteria bacterium]|nr:hypothetical protein [Pseudomonadota bacterium]
MRRGIIAIFATAFVLSVSATVFMPASSLADDKKANKAASACTDIKDKKKKSACMKTEVKAAAEAACADVAGKKEKSACVKAETKKAKAKK